MNFHSIAERFLPLQTRLLSLQDDTKSYEFAFSYSYFNKELSQFLEPSDYWLFFETKIDFVKFLQFELPIYLLNNLDTAILPSVEEELDYEFNDLDINDIANLLQYHFSDIDAYFAFAEKQEHLIKLGFEIGFSELLNFYKKLSSTTNIDIYGQLMPQWIGAIQQLKSSKNDFEKAIVTQFNDQPSIEHNLINNLILLNKLQIQFENLNFHNAMPAETLMGMSEAEIIEFRAYVNEQVGVLTNLIKQTSNAYINDKFNALIKDTKINFL